jgi:hypothetical protein
MDAWLARQSGNEGIKAMAGDDQGTLLVSEGMRAPDSKAGALVVRPRPGASGDVAGHVLEIAVPAPGATRQAPRAMRHAPL